MNMSALYSLHLMDEVKHRRVMTDCKCRWTMQLNEGQVDVLTNRLLTKNAGSSRAN